MLIVTVLASIGAFLSTVSNIPQVWKVRKKHSTDDLHSWSVMIHMVSALIWASYGYLLNLYILGIESFVVFLLYVLIFCAILRDRYFFPPTIKFVLPPSNV